MFKAAKYPPIGGVSPDKHQVLLFAPPPPPAPPTPCLPTNLWITQIYNQASGFFLTGKWCWASVSEDGLGIILQGHDWGFGQFHWFTPPVVCTPTHIVLTLKNTTKYWLGAYSVEAKRDGSIPGASGTVAVTTPAWFILCQQCWDVNGLGFFMPSALIFQAPGTVDISMTFADIMASFMGMVVDSIVSCLCGRITNSDDPQFLGNETLKFVLAQGFGYFANFFTAVYEHVHQDDPYAKEKSYVLQTALVAASIIGLGDLSGGGKGVLEEIVKMTGNYVNDKSQTVILDSDTKAKDYNELLNQQR
jgi:hypothetical protein